MEINTDWSTAGNSVNDDDTSNNNTTDNHDDDDDEHDQDLLDKYGQKLTSVLSSPSTNSNDNMIPSFTDERSQREEEEEIASKSFPFNNDNDTLSSSSSPIKADKYRYDEGIVASQSMSKEESDWDTGSANKMTKKKVSSPSAAAASSRSLLQRPLSISTTISQNDQQEGEEQIELISPCTAASGLTFTSSVDNGQKDVYEVYDDTMTHNLSSVQIVVNQKNTTSDVVVPPTKDDDNDNNELKEKSELSITKTNSNNSTTGDHYLKQLNSYTSGSSYSSLNEEDYYTTTEKKKTETSTLPNQQQTPRRQQERHSTPLRSNYTADRYNDNTYNNNNPNDESIESTTSFPSSIKKKLSSPPKPSDQISLNDSPLSSLHSLDNHVQTKASMPPDLEINATASLSFVGALNAYGDKALVDKPSQSLEEDEDSVIVEQSSTIESLEKIKAGDRYIENSSGKEEKEEESVGTHSTLHSNDYNIDSGSDSVNAKDDSQNVETPNGKSESATTTTTARGGGIADDHPKITTSQVSPPSAHNGGHYPNNPSSNDSPLSSSTNKINKKEKDDEDCAPLGSYLMSFEGMQKDAIEKIHTSWALDNPCHTLEEVIQDMGCQTFPFFHHPTTQEPVYTRDAAIFTLATKCEYCGSLSTNECNPKTCRRPKLYFLKKKSPFDTGDNEGIWDKDTEYRVEDMHRFVGGSLVCKKNDLVVSPMSAASGGGGENGVAGGDSNGAAIATSGKYGGGATGDWSTDSPQKGKTQQERYNIEEEGIDTNIGIDDSASWTSSFVGQMGKFVSSPSWGGSSHA